MNPFVVTCPACREWWCLECSPVCPTCQGAEDDIRLCCECVTHHCSFCEDMDFCRECERALCEGCARELNRSWQKGACTACAKGEKPVEKELPDYPEIPEGGSRLTQNHRMYQTQKQWLKERRDWWQAQVTRLVAERDEARGTARAYLILWCDDPKRIDDEMKRHPWLNNERTKDTDAGRDGVRPASPATEIPREPGP